MPKFSPCQKTILGITAGLLVIAIICPFVLPKIVALVNQFSIAEPVYNGNQTEISVKSNDSSCHFFLSNTIVLNEQQFMFCQLAFPANAITARKVCQGFNSRFVNGRNDFRFQFGRLYRSFTASLSLHNFQWADNLNLVTNLVIINLLSIGQTDQFYLY